MSDVRWYATLALWKAAVFLEGTYKRRLAGTTDDAFFDTLDDRRPGPRRARLGDLAWCHDRRGLIVDWGGVLTTDVFASFRAFCVAEGLAPDTVRELFREDPRARELLAGLETGELDRDAFQTRSPRCSGVAPDGIVERLFGGDRARRGDDRRGARGARRRPAHRAALELVGRADDYDRALLEELFDAWVISGEVGMRKPDPAIYVLAAERVGAAAGGARSSTTSRQPQAGAARWAWRRSSTARRRRRSPSSSGCSASRWAARAPSRRAGPPSPARAGAASPRRRPRPGRAAGRAPRGRAARDRG